MPNLDPHMRMHVVRGLQSEMLQRAERDRIHRSRRHVGKIPPHATQDADRQAALMVLRQKLREAIESEAYEEAAGLRDRIKKLEES